LQHLLFHIVIIAHASKVSPEVTLLTIAASLLKVTAQSSNQLSALQENLRQHNQFFKSTLVRRRS
jgi:hypothetical protein